MEELIFPSKLKRAALQNRAGNSGSLDHRRHARCPGSLETMTIYSVGSIDIQAVKASWAGVRGEWEAGLTRGRIPGKLRPASSAGRAQHRGSQAIIYPARPAPAFRDPGMIERSPCLGGEDEAASTECCGTKVIAASTPPSGRRSGQKDADTEAPVNRTRRLAHRYLRRIRGPLRHSTDGDRLIRPSWPRHPRRRDRKPGGPAWS
jgi:hypothetical protein